MLNKRLTTITAKGAVLILDNPQNETEARMQLMKKYRLAITKLSLYEKLEEEGKIVVPLMILENPMRGTDNA